MVEDDSAEILKDIPKDDHVKQVRDTDDMRIGNGEELPSVVMGEDGIDMSMNLWIPDLIPLVFASDAATTFRYPYVHLPILHSLYSDVLMGLSIMRSNCDCILPVGCYAVFVGVYWSIMDGDLYWRSVLFVHGIMVEQIVIFTWHAVWLAIIRGCVEISHQSCTFPSLHISKLTMWDVVCMCYYGIVKDDNSYSFVCWKHDMKHP